jgi:hypothetical protein
MLASLKAVLARPAKAAAKPVEQSPGAVTTAPAQEKEASSTSVSDDEDSYFEESDDEAGPSPATSAGTPLEQVQYTPRGSLPPCLTTHCT